MWPLAAVAGVVDAAESSIPATTDHGSPMPSHRPVTVRASAPGLDAVWASVRIAAWASALAWQWVALAVPPAVAVAVGVAVGVDVGVAVGVAVAVDVAVAVAVAVGVGVGPPVGDTRTK